MKKDINKSKHLRERLNNTVICDDPKPLNEKQGMLLEQIKKRPLKKESGVVILTSKIDASFFEKIKN